MLRKSVRMGSGLLFQNFSLVSRFTLTVEMKTHLEIGKTSERITVYTEELDVEMKVMCESVDWIQFA
jgi:hypothetical protein